MLLKAEVVEERLLHHHALAYHRFIYRIIDEMNQVSRSAAR
jgi:hypothetical protein